MTCIDISKIFAEIFDDASIAARIRRDYRIQTNATGEALYVSLLDIFGQRECKVDEVLGEAVPKTTAHLEIASYNKIVYEAATRSLASNMRAWWRVNGNLPTIRSLLCDWDYKRVKEIPEHTQVLQCLAHILGGYTGKRDSQAIVDWSNYLTQIGSYALLLQKLRKHFRDTSIQQNILPLREHELTALVAATIGAGLNTAWVAAPIKAPGMGPTLASEFLRNLGWSGFKPDRHVKRLLSCWTQGKDCNKSANRANELRGLLTGRSRDVDEFLYYSILGPNILPDPLPRPISQIDQIIWLYGVYVKPVPRKKRKSPGE